mgnify:CR=1 FL=1
MTRFIMSLEEAVDLVIFAFEHGQNGDILVFSRKFLLNIFESCYLVFSLFNCQNTSIVRIELSKFVTLSLGHRYPSWRKDV